MTIDRHLGMDEGAAAPSPVLTLYNYTIVHDRQLSVRSERHERFDLCALAL